MHDEKSDMNDKGKDKVDEMLSLAALPTHSQALPRMVAKLFDAQIVLGVQLLAIAPLAANDVSEFPLAAGAVVRFRETKKQHFVFRGHTLAKFERV